MKICVIGKRASIIGWVEGAVAGFRAAGHTVLHAITRDPRLHPALDRMLVSPRLGAPRSIAIMRRLRAFAPDMIVAVDAFSTPLSLLRRLRGMPGLPPLVGWVGDRFSDADGQLAAYFDMVGYTDSGLLARHRALNLPGAAVFLPHAANTLMADASGPPPARADRMVFVANPTPLRMAIVAKITEPVALYGAGWANFPGTAHEIHARRVPLEQVGDIYRRHPAVLNIRNEHHVLAGLNQRNFDPYLCGAAVLSDAQPDLESCFAPGSEVLVYRDIDELNGTYAKLRRDPAWAEEVAQRGRQRVLRDHTYDARLRRIAALIGVRVTASA